MSRLLILLLTMGSLCAAAQRPVVADVLIVGGGTGGTAAGIQSARLGAKTIIVESGPWLGGMISAAGVTATDGNHNLPSGIWNEFRNALYKVYGGPKAVATGWVSLTQFEPHVADSIFKSMAAKEKNLTVRFNHSFVSLVKKKGRIVSVLVKDKRTNKVFPIAAKIFIDATELGDVMAAAGVPYDLGMEAESSTGENVGVKVSNDIVQDLTWAATLKDYGPGADKTIAKPAAYDPAEFDGCCTDYYHDKSRKAPTVDAQKMLDYGRLPHGKFMINWPGYGNDTYLNVVEMTEAEREKELDKAKQTTLRFVYFIQHELGFKNLGLADDEFPTADKLALMPYHREGRRAKGLVRMTVRHIAEPFTYGDALYRTGVSVGDYPIDHHHKKNPEAPQHLDFHPVPSFNVPLGALIPQRGADNLVVAEKSISVSNVVNGTTRLQPCVMLTGQAAGVLAALSAKQNLPPRAVPVRTVQSELLKAKAYLMPYMDVKPDNPHWEAVQKIGATGILKGVGVPYKWANQTWFYPDSLVSAPAINKVLAEFNGNLVLEQEEGFMTVGNAIATLERLRFQKSPWGNNPLLKKPIKVDAKIWDDWNLKNYDPARPISRVEFAVLLNKTTDPFSLKSVDHNGTFRN